MSAAACRRHTSQWRHTSKWLPLPLPHAPLERLAHERHEARGRHGGHLCRQRVCHLGAPLLARRGAVQVTGIQVGPVAQVLQAQVALRIIRLHAGKHLRLAQHCARRVTLPQLNQLQHHLWVGWVVG